MFHEIMKNLRILMLPWGVEVDARFADRIDWKCSSVRGALEGSIDIVINWHRDIDPTKLAVLIWWDIHRKLFPQPESLE